MKNFSEYTRKYNRSAQENHKNVIEATSNTGIKRNRLMQKYPESLGTCLGLILGIYRFVDVERRCLSLGVNHNTHVVWKDNAKAWANTVYRYDVTISITALHFELKTFVNKNEEGKRTYPSPYKPKGNGWS